MRLDVILPALGSDIKELTIADVLVKPGDHVVFDQPLFMLETDKTTFDFSSPFAGEVAEILVRKGSQAGVGAILGRIDVLYTNPLILASGSRGDIMTGLNYLAGREEDWLCSRKALGQHNFNDYREFIEEAGEIARQFKNLLGETLGQPIEDRLRESLHFVTGLVSQVQGFNPSKLGSTRLSGYIRVRDELERYSSPALENFRMVLEDASHESTTTDPDPTKAFVFISYSHPDAAIARRLAGKLKRARIAFFLDEQVRFGEHIPQRIHAEVQRASHMLVIISSSSAKSSWVPFELGIAKAFEIITVPYLVNADVPVPSFIVNERHVREAADEPKLIDELVRFRRESRSLNLPGSPDVEAWRAALAKDRIAEAREILHQSVASYPSMLDAVRELENLVRNGGQLRCILTDPYGLAITQGIIRNIGATASIENLQTQFVATKRLLGNVQRCRARGGRVTLKVVDFLPDPILTIVDPSQSAGAIFVTLNGFGQNPAARPNLRLLKERDQSWFNFYLNSFDKLWNHPLSQEVELTGD